MVYPDKNPASKIVIFNNSGLKLTRAVTFSGCIPLFLPERGLCVRQQKGLPPGNLVLPGFFLVGASLNPFADAPEVLGKQGPRNWLCQAAGAAAPSGKGRLRVVSNRGG
jgi:hypothetical protein